MKTISKLIGVSKLDFVNYQSQEYANWCVTYAQKNFIPSRLLDINEALFNWYCLNWDNKLKLFLNENKDYIEAGVVDEDSYFRLFYDCVPKSLLLVYPTTIIERIKKQHYETIGIAYPYSKSTRKIS